MLNRPTATRFMPQNALKYGQEAFKWRRGGIALEIVATPLRPSNQA